MILSRRLSLEMFTFKLLHFFSNLMQIPAQQKEKTPSIIGNEIARSSISILITTKTQSTSIGAAGSAFNWLQSQSVQESSVRDETFD